MNMKTIFTLLITFTVTLYLTACAQQPVVTLSCNDNVTVFIDEDNYQDTILNTCTVTVVEGEYTVDDSLLSMDPVVDTSQEGETTVTVSYIDESNKLDVSQDVVVTVAYLDTTAPEVSVKSMIFYEGNEMINWYDQIISITDDHDTEFNIEVDDSKLNYLQTGTYDVIISVTDQSGNSTTKHIVVTVVVEYLMATTTIENLVHEPSQISMDVVLENDLITSSLTYTLYQSDIYMDSVNTMNPVDGYIDIPVENLRIVVDDLDFDTYYRVEVSYTTQINGFEKLGQTSSEIINHETPILSSTTILFPTTTTVEYSVHYASEYRDALVGLDVYNVDTGVIEQTIPAIDVIGTIDLPSMITDLVPNTNYQLQYLFYDGYQITDDYKTASEEEGDTVSLTFHIFLFDEAYSNSGIGVYINDEWLYYPVTSTDEYGGVVTIDIPYTTTWLGDTMDVNFYKDLDTKEQIGITVEADTWWALNRFDMSLDYYYFQGDYSLYQLHPGAIFVFSTSFMFSYHAYDPYGTSTYWYDYIDFQGILRNGYAKPLHYAYQDSGYFPILSSVIEIAEGTPSVEVAMSFDSSYTIDTSTTTGATIGYFLPYSEGNLNAEMFLTEYVNRINMYNAYSVYAIYLNNDGDFVLPFDHDRYLGDVMNMTNITVIDDQGVSYTATPSLPDIPTCDTSFINISFNNEFVASGNVGLIGDFNDWDVSRAIDLSGQYDGEVSICISDSGSFTAILDADDNGFDDNDETISPTLNYSIDNQYYHIVLAFSEQWIELHTTISIVYNVDITMAYQDQYDFIITYELDGEIHEVHLYNVTLDYLNYL